MFSSEKLTFSECYAGKIFCPLLTRYVIKKYTIIVIFENSTGYFSSTILALNIFFVPNMEKNIIIFLSISVFICKILLFPTSKCWLLYLRMNLKKYKLLINFISISFLI